MASFSAAPPPLFPAADRRPSSGPISTPRPRTTSWATILTLFALFVCHALAATADASLPVETLIIDTRSPYRRDNGWVMLSPEDAKEWRRWQKRQNDEDEKTTTTTTKPSSTPSATRSVTTTFSIVVSKSTSTSVAASALPTPLDSMSNDFTPGSGGETSNCPRFINNFRNSEDFKSCYPLSLLLENSRSFFESQKSLVALTRVLDATCNANATKCTTYFSSLARELIAPENCGVDYDRGQTTIKTVYQAMMAYAPIYSVGCLRDAETSAYCYANAATNRTSPGSNYMYFLPLNSSLPGSSTPACSYCNQQTMNMYQAATADRRQSIANTYTSAAKQINLVCGPNWVNETLAAEVVRSGGVRGVTTSTVLATAVSVVVAFSLLI
ncbi:hypothetical protein QBC35DRAFT_380104 [Podospora australis]|uniref:DUF7729 domain-containing protein n=1 Tax=Podospora australis TaxID=1536484 RepID=A0AAN7AI61_9PEZI|nr:hypothetical protein QBC35DRAFT_380104 [Podospora australis]